jgi:photosystem II stability/assembly factor-like uncharacterized protein
MRMTRILAVVVLLLLLFPRARAQEKRVREAAPDAAASPTQGADVLWYGEAPPGWGGAVTRMKLTAPDVGWAERAGRLYWTNNGGVNWKDITPPGDGSLAGIFFLNPSKGWITINHLQNAGVKQTFDVVSTKDGGATWSRTTIPLSQHDYGIDLPDLRGGEAGTIVFLDSLHGWMNISFEAQTSNTWSSAMLVTSDGGRTWTKASDAPIMRNPEMLIMSPCCGWLYGNEFSSRWSLYVTRDDAHSWDQVYLEVPESTESSVVGLPIFQDGKNGFLQVNGVHRKDRKLLLNMALMKTSDGGRTWKLDRQVSNLNDVQRRQYGSPAVVGSDWIFAAAADHRPMLTKVGEGARVDAMAAPESRSEYKSLTQINWANPTRAWAVVGDGVLMSTADGGATWTDISPGAAAD